MFETMPLGPFDARTKRTRCAACSASHLKCSGDVPCDNCSRRRISCTYARKATKKLILIERGSQKTQTDWSILSNKSCFRPKATSPQSKTVTKPASGSKPSVCLIDETSRYLSFFDTFVKSNSFTGHGRTAGDEVIKLANLHSRKGNHVLHAMLAIGGMFATKRNLVDATACRETLLVAFQHYSYSIAGLREAINGLERAHRIRQRKNYDEHVCVLWTTLFLGLFELMNDATGRGWQQHIIHGTCMALKASGPAVCRSEMGLPFFIQARIFEISRTILFNESTFLTEEEWVALSRDLSSEKGVHTWSPLDSLLDVMVMCSDLRVRAAAFIEGRQNAPHPEPSLGAVSISEDGFKLREALNTWSSAYIPNQAIIGEHDRLTCIHLREDTTPIRASDEELVKEPSTLLSQVFHASISIYLSGVYDYELAEWNDVGLSVPILDERSVARHLHTILTLTRLALDKTSLSPLLFLFPLRIAGARSYAQNGRDTVSELVAQVGKSFAVAGAIETDLAAVWEVRAIQRHERAGTR